MIYYEVNVELPIELYNEYLTWLTSHVQSILNLQGFIDAQIMNVLQPESTTKQSIIVLYKLISLEALENYLTHNAPRMRQSTLDKFGDKLNINRRILESVDTSQNKI